MDEKLELLAIINELLQEHGPKHGVTNVTMENDHKSGEIIMGYKGQEWVVSSAGMYLWTKR